MYQASPFDDWVMSFSKFALSFVGLTLLLKNSWHNQYHEWYNPVAGIGCNKVYQFFILRNFFNDARSVTWTHSLRDCCLHKVAYCCITSNKMVLSNLVLCCCRKYLWFYSLVILYEVYFLGWHQLSNIPAIMFVQEKSTIIVKYKY